MNIEIDQNNLRIDFHDIYFDYNIRQIIVMDTQVIVLLKVTGNENAPRNVFCIDPAANILWQIESSDKYFKRTGAKKAACASPVKYTGIRLRESDGLLQVNDFAGRRFIVDPSNGHIIEKISEGREW